jgi:hypothetical protein
MFLRENPAITALLQCENGAPVRIDEEVSLRVGERVWLPKAALI